MGTDLTPRVPLRQEWPDGTWAELHLEVKHGGIRLEISDSADGFQKITLTPAQVAALMDAVAVQACPLLDIDGEWREPPAPEPNRVPERPHWRDVGHGCVVRDDGAMLAAADGSDERPSVSAMDAYDRAQPMRSGGSGTDPTLRDLTDALTRAGWDLANATWEAIGAGAIVDPDDLRALLVAVEREPTMANLEAVARAVEAAVVAGRVADKTGNTGRALVDYAAAYMAWRGDAG
jgi:hypothetical protein